VNDYRIVLDQFISYISKEKGIRYYDVKAEMINRKSVEGYLDDLQKQKEIKPSTRNNRLAAIKSFLK
jgi:site-specific recombinase XerD